MMVKTIQIVLIVLTALTSFGQVKVKHLPVPPPVSTYLPTSEVMKYPLFETGNEAIDEKLNHNFKVDFLSPSDPTIPTEEALKEWSGTIIYCEPKITYNKNGIISILMSAEGCGAYCTSWSEPLVYSSETGERLSIAALVDTTASFKDLVVEDYKAQFRDHEKELASMLTDEDEPIDSATYTWALSELAYCKDDLNFEKYILYEGRIEIHAPCYMAHAIQNLGIHLKLSYSFTSIGGDLIFKP